MDERKTPRHSSVALAKRTPTSDNATRRRMIDAVANHKCIAMTFAPRVFFAGKNWQLPGNSPKFVLRTRAEGVEVLRRFAEWAEAEKKRVEAGRG